MSGTGVTFGSKTEDHDWTWTRRVDRWSDECGDEDGKMGRSSPGLRVSG